MNKISDNKRILDLEYKLICDFIKLRKDSGLTQKELALESGVVRDGYTLSIAKIEKE